MSRRSTRLVAAAICLAILSSGGMAYAGPKGNGNGPDHRTPAGSCVVDGNTVTGSGLPEDDLMNFWITEPDGSSWGWVLGVSGTGDWSVIVPDRTDYTTYEFISEQKGKDGKNYDVYARCAAS